MEDNNKVAVKTEKELAEAVNNLEDNNTVTVKTEKELAEAVKNGANIIVIKGTFKDLVIKIIVTGKVAWCACIGAIAVSITAICLTAPTGGSSNTVHIFTVPIAVSTLGYSVAATAMSIAIAGGGVAVLNKLRKYKIVQQTDDVVILKRK